MIALIEILELFREYCRQDVPLNQALIFMLVVRNGGEVSQKQLNDNLCKRTGDKKETNMSGAAVSRNLTALKTHDLLNDRDGVGGNAKEWYLTQRGFKLRQEITRLIKDMGADL